MPILSKSPSGTVTGLWGSAFVKLPNGKLKPLQVGDSVKPGEQIITTQDGIVQITNPKGKVAEVKPVAPVSDIDRDIAAVERGDEAPAAGLTGGGEGGLTPGLRVDRVSESVTQLNFEFGTERLAPEVPTVVAQPLFFTAPTPEPTVSGVSSPIVAEGGNLDFQITLSNPPTTAATQVVLQLSSGSATVGTDTGPVQVSLDGGQTFQTVTPSPNGSITVNVPVNTPADAIVVRVPTVPDAISEGPETLTLTAGTPQNATPAAGTGTINDGNGLPSLSINDVEVNEAAGTATFTVTLSGPSSTQVTVNYGTQDGSAKAGQDYTANSGTLTFAPGETSKTITVAITNDNIYEGIEQYQVVLSNASANAQIGDGTGVGGINDQGGPTTPPPGPNVPPTTPDDDRPVVSSVSSPSATEGSPLDFTVTLSKQSTTATSVTLKLTGETATLGTDTGTVRVSTDGGATYQTVTVAADGSFTVSVPANAPTNALHVQVPTVADNLSEGAETVKLTAGTTQNTTPAAGTGTINDGNDLPTVSIDDVEVNEGAGQAVFTLTLSHPSSTDVVVRLSTVDGDATSVGSANGDKDFNSFTGLTVVIPAGQTSVTVPVVINNDTVYEDSESFGVQIISTSGNATIGKGEGLGTITDYGNVDDPNDPTLDNDRPTVASVSDAIAVEGDNLDFTVTLSNTSKNVTPLLLKISGVEATLGVDTGEVQVSVDGGKSFVAVAVDGQGNFQVQLPPGAAVDALVVRVPTTIDGVSEGAETLQISASTLRDLEAGTPSEIGTGTINDGNGLPSLSINDVEVNEAAGTATFTVTLSGPSSTQVTVNYGTQDGSAKAGQDYTANSGTLTFAPGETSKTITVAITNDNIYEGIEQYQVVLSNVSANAQIGDGTGVGGINDQGGPTTPPPGPNVPPTTPDDDRPVVSSVSSPSATEGSPLDFTVTLSKQSTTATSVTLKLTGETATLGTDTGTVRVSTDGGATYQTVTVAADGSFTVSVPANAPTNALHVQVPTVADNLSEGAETVKLTAGTTQNTTPAAGTGTINDGNGLPSLSINDVEVNEAAGTATFTVTLSGPSSTQVTVNYGTQDGSAKAGQDYTANSGTLTFAPGETSKTITVAITNDNIYEGIEQYQVVLSNVSANAQIGDGTGVGGINDQGGPTTPPPGPNVPPTTPDDDRPVVSSVSSPSATEGSPLDFTVTLSKQSTTATSVTLKLTGETATLGTDTGTVRVSTDGGATYQTVTVAADGSFTVSVPANAPTNALHVQVPTVADNLSEGAETVKLTAGTTQNTTPAAGTGTINDGNGLPSLSINDVEVNEAAGTATFTVTLSGPSSTQVTVNYGTQDGSAKAGQDYTANSGTLTFAPGETSKTITVAITNDNIYEGIEQYQVVLSNVSANAQIGDGTGVGGINDQGGPTTPPPGPNVPPTTPDDDRPVVSSVSSPSATEGSPLDFTVTLSKQSTTATSVTLKLTGETATLGTDTGTVRVSTDGGATYQTVTVAADGSFTVSVPANAPTNALHVQVPTVADNLSEGAETVKLTAGTTQNTTPAAGTGTINDANGLPSLSINDVEVNEAAGTATFTVTLSGPSSTQVTVNYGTQDGSAKAGQDYTANSGTLTFAPGETSKTITVAITNDNIYEGIEQYQVVLSNVSANAQIGDGTGVGGINDQGGPTTPPPGPNVPPTTPDDDRPVVSSVSSPSATEGSPLDFTVTLSKQSTTATSVTLKLTGETATLGTDTGTVRVSTDGGATYQTVTVAADGSFTVSVPANAPTNALHVQVPTVADNLSEGAETVKLTAGTTQNTTPAAGTGTINDGNGLPSLSINDVEVNEAAGTATFTVTLSGPSSTQVTVNYGTQDGSAKAGQDYTANSGTLTFAPGETSKTITVAITNDNIYEGIEQYQVVLSNVSANAQIGDGTGVGGINDQGGPTTPPPGPNVPPTTPDDDRPTVASITSPSVTEGQPLGFVVKLSNQFDTAVSVKLTLTGGTGAQGKATIGVDTGTVEYSVDGGVTYSQAVIAADGSFTVVVPAGTNGTRVDSILVRVPTVDDVLPEGAETLTLSGQTTRDASEGRPVVAGTGTIVDNDAPPAVDLDADNSSGIPGNGYQTTYTENGTPIAIADLDIRITDVDSTVLRGATIKLTNAQTGDTFAVVGTLPSGISASVSNGTITLTGAASLADYQTAIRQIGFANTTDTPATVDRVITVTVNDGTSDSAVATTTIKVIAVNDPPEVTDTPTNPGGPGTSFDPNTGNYSHTTPEDTPVSGQVKATDKDGDALTFTKGSDPAHGTVTVNPDGTWTYTPNPDYNGGDSFKVVVSDGKGGTDTSIVNIGVTPVNDAPVLVAQTAAVSEEGLAGGLADNTGAPSDTTNASTVSGTIAASDPDGATPSNWTLEAPTTVLTSGGVAVTWSGNGTQTLTATAGGVTVGTLTINNNGGYTFTLKAPLDHPVANAEDVLPLNFTVRASDGQLTGATTLTINVEDDSPSAAVPQTRDTSAIDTNIMVILDMSTSMNNTDGVNGTTRLASAIASINSLLDKYDALGDVRVRLVTFGTNAEARGDVWTTVAEARTILTNLGTTAPNNQGTNYDEALGDAITAFASAGKLGSAQNVSYFISDGAPTFGSGNTSQLTASGQSPGTPATNGTGTDQSGSDTGIQAGEEALWKNFLTSNQIDSFALGVGGVTAAQRTYLDPIAFDGRAVADRNGVVVSAFSQLDGVLATTIPASINGNLLSGSFLGNGSVGADAPGHVKSLTVNGITYTYHPENGGSITVTGGTSAGVFDTTTDTLTITAKLADGSVGGKFIVDMDGGDYRYEVPPTVPVSGVSEVLNFVITDRDGDTTGSSLTVNVSKPTVTNGTAGADTLNGGSGIDFITGGEGNDTINGGAGDDKLYGNNGDDIVNGGAGNDVLHGGAGNDTLNGGDGNDLLIGGAGNDTLTGGLGSDVFQWTLADPGTSAATRATDTIKDFNVSAASAGGDVLDLRDLLTGENSTGGAGNLQNFLDFDTSTGNTVIRISPTGAFSNGTYAAASDHQQIVLEGVNIRTGLGLAANATDAQIITKLIQDGKLLVDN